jgi:hypothetical protein
VECVDTVISGNIAGNTAANWGGAIYALYGTGNTISATITGNTANNSGGGVYIRIATNYTISATLTGNTANNNGGGVYIDRGSSHTISAAITDNTASLGGGVCFNDTSPNATHSFNNAIIHSNSDYGAAIVNRNSNPQGIDTINWGTGNTPENINWDEQIFVSVSGDDNNPGTKAFPVKTIQTAISKAIDNDYIYVAQGIYTPGNGLNTDNVAYQHSGAFIHTAGLTILGGWDADFTERNGITELDGNSALKHVVWIADVVNVTIDGFVIRGGLANGSNPHHRAGGIYINQGSGHLIQNTVISNNTAIHGGGVFVNGGTGHTISGTISGNTANNNGGGVYVQQGTSHTLSGTITGNSANNGGGVFVDTGTGHTISATITGNTAANNGGGLAFQYATGYTISGTITGNSANNNGGGVYIDRGSSHTISAAITDNTASLGGGVCFYDTSPNATHSFNNAIIHGNSDYGVAIVNRNSNPQGIDTINWGTGNTPINLNWGDYVCVSTMGDDGNNGLNSHPVKSIQKAIQLAESDNLQSIRVAQGIYTPDNGLNTDNADYQHSGVFITNANVTILGGWDADFTERNGISELDGNSALKHVIWIDNVANVTIDGFVIRGGLANAGSDPHRHGGGVYINQGSGHLIQNTVISNNTAVGGSGVWIQAGTSHTISATITGNTATWGGGVYVWRGTSHTINGTITGNTANTLGGGVYFNDGSANDTHTFVSPTISGNSSYGVYRANANSNPQGIGTINWGSGNTPANMNW